jgi:hypothetical protein
MGSDQTPWDIYVDERKVVFDYAVGFLVVPNTASFLHKLYRSRQRPADAHGRTRVTREIHWNRPHLDSLQVALNWIDCVFQHNGAKFFCHGWPAGETKELVILRFLAEFAKTKGLTNPYNVVVFLDFDSDHAKTRIQNTIRESGRIARCYHLDSTNNDCIQCCDLLLGATCLVTSDPTVRLDYSGLKATFDAGEKLRDSQIKRLIAGYLASKIDADGTAVYDLRITSSR